MRVRIRRSLQARERVRTDIDSQVGGRYVGGRLGNLQRRGHLNRRRQIVRGPKGVRGGLRSERVLLARTRLVSLLVPAAALAVVSPLITPLEAVAVVVMGVVVLLRR